MGEMHDLKPYWVTPAVRDFRGGEGNGCAEQSLQCNAPTAPSFYSTWLRELVEADIVEAVE